MAEEKKARKRPWERGPRKRPWERRPRKRPWERGPRERTQRSRVWDRTGFSGKTVWDWLQLLIVPIALSLITVGFAWQQNIRQQEIENERAKSAQKIEAQRAQDAALQAYLDQMGELVLKEDFRTTEEGNEVRLLLRARTLTVLQRLENPSRKEEVLRFLQEAELVQRVDGKGPVISLLDAELHGIGFTRAALHGTDLYAADLSDAYLFEADLSQAILTLANLREANLSGADLSGADLSEADLSGADLSDTNLNDAYLLGANLAEADLSGASGVTKEQLEQQVYSLEGTTMTGSTVLPAQGKISAGEYISDEFYPPLSFRVGDGWTVWTPETYEELFIATEPEGGQLHFTKPPQVYASSDPGARKPIPAPENTDEWVSWLQRHPNLNSSKPVPVSLGDEPGVRIHVTATSRQANCEGDPCVPLFPTASGETTSTVQGKDQFIIVDIGGETVVINVYAPADKLEEFLPKAEKVLDTVEWKGA